MIFFFCREEGDDLVETCDFLEKKEKRKSKVLVMICNFEFGLWTNWPLIQKQPWTRISQKEKQTKL